MRTAEITCILTTLRTIDDINNRRYENTDANLYPVQGSDRLEMHELPGRRTMVTRTHCVVEREICMHMCCACSYCTEYATFEMLRLAGRRPAMKRTTV